MKSSGSFFFFLTPFFRSFFLFFFFFFLLCFLHLFPVSSIPIISSVYKLYCQSMHAVKTVLHNTVLIAIPVVNTFLLCIIYWFSLSCIRLNCSMECSPFSEKKPSEDSFKSSLFQNNWPAKFSLLPLLSSIVVCPSL